MLPLATIFDPEDIAEGSLDPLATYLISESLASSIGSPGVRERQNNLRFLTLCCIGWEVMSSVDPDITPGDASSGIEQVFEWLVVEALVSGSMGDETQSLRLPGIFKARQCLEQGLHMNADRYLRTASVFGFFGVYRTLAEYIKLVVPQSGDTPLLGPEGIRLFEVWRQEQGLPAFGKGHQGSGQREFRDLVDAFKKTWQAGQVVPDKSSFGFIQKYMQPGVPGGPRETEELLRLIREPGSGTADEYRRELLKALEKPEFNELFRGKAEDERFFHDKLMGQASSGLQKYIRAIQAYEDFIGSLHGVFDDLLFILSRQSKLLPIDEVAAMIPNIFKRVKSVPALFKEADDSLTLFPQLRNRFTGAFELFNRQLEPAIFLKVLLEHHEGVQKRKPPDGKAPWFERQGDKIAVRPLYRRKDGARTDNGYIYFYRAQPLLDLVQGARGQYGKA